MLLSVAVLVEALVLTPEPQRWPSQGTKRTTWNCWVMDWGITYIYNNAPLQFGHHRLCPHRARVKHMTNIKGHG